MSQTADRLPPATTGVFGRAREVQAIVEFVTAIDRPSGFLLEGQAGIGKTAVWRAAVEWTHQSSARTLTAFPTIAETKLPYSGLGDLLTGLDDSIFHSVPNTQRSALDAALLRVERTEDRNSGTYERAICAGTLNVLSNLAHIASVVIAVDDVHWLDLPSAEVLSYVFRRIEAPIGLLMTARSGETIPSGLDRVISGPGFRRLRLSAMTLDQLDLTILDHLGNRLPLPVLIEVGRSSGGNPMFALELARALEDGRVDYQPGLPLEVPTDLRDIVADRLAGLPDGTIELLAMVAGMSHPTRDLVDRILPDAAPQLRRTIDEGLLRARGDRLVLTHPLYGSVPLAELAPSRRRTLYARAAAAVDDIEESARLLALATYPPDERVAKLLEDAGRHAEQRGAPQTGAALLEQAAHYSVEGTARTERMLLAARCFFRSNHADRAVQLYEEVIGRCVPGNRRAAITFERLLVADLPIAEHITRQEDLLDEATDPSLRARISCQLAWDLIATYQIQRAGFYVRAARDEAALAKDKRLRAKAMGLAATLHFFSGDGVRRDLAEEAMKLELDSGRRAYDETSPRHRWALICLWADLLDEGRRYFLELREESIVHGSESGLCLIDLYLSVLESRAGNWSDARRYAESADRIQELLYGYPGATVARVDALEGRLDAARRTAEEELARALEQQEPFAEVTTRCVLALVALSEGDFDGVISQLTQVQGYLDKQEFGEPDLLRFHPDLVEAYVATGKLDEAKAVVTHLESIAVPTEGAAALAALTRCRGWVEVNDGDVADGLERLAQSVAFHRALGQPFELARTWLLLGGAQRRSRMWAKARTSLREARDIFATLGSPAWVTKVDRELERIGGRAPSRWELTPAEEQIADLASRGRTNAEIASELSVTVKTVEWTLSKVYRKLMIRSRTELAGLLRVE
jgi:DNA-binding CsgD family transcriptional regulator